MNEAMDLLERANDLLAELARAQFAAIDDDSLCTLVAATEQAGRFIDTVRALSAAEVEQRSRHELGREGLAQRHGHARGAHFVEQMTRVSQAEAVRRTRLGSAILPRTALDGHELPPRYPLIAAAMTSGTMGTDAAAGVIRCLEQAAARHAAPEALDAAEASLVGTAATEPADLVAVHARVWRETLDPDGARPRDEELRGRREFKLGREVDGMSPFSGAADPVHAALLRAAFAEGSGPGITPRFLSEEDRERGTETVTTPEGNVIEMLHDPRTRAQRQFDIAMGLLTAGLRTTEGKPGSMRSTTTVMAVIQLKDLESGTGVGWLDDVAEPVSAATVQELACDSGYRRIALGDDGEVLYLGLPERFFSAAQRKALAVRDGGCVWSGCTAPPSWCHAHHVIEYEHGGKTDIDNGALLCSAHHHMLHSSEFTMKMIRGKPHLLAPPWLDPDQVWRPVGRTRAIMAA